MCPGQTVEMAEYKNNKKKKSIKNYARATLTHNIDIASVWQGNMLTKC